MCQMQSLHTVQFSSFRGSLSLATAADSLVETLVMVEKIDEAGGLGGFIGSWFSASRP